MKQMVTKDPNTGHVILNPSPTCEDKIKEPECGYGVSIVSGTEVFVGEQKEHLFNNKTWSELREGAILIPPEESYAPLVTYIINSCKKNKCDAEVSKFKVKLDTITTKNQ